MQKKLNFSEGDTVDIPLDGVQSADVALQTGSANHANAAFEAYVSVDGAGFYGPVKMIDPNDRATPITTLTGVTKQGTIDCAGQTVLRVKRKADGVGGAAQALAWNITLK